MRSAALMAATLMLALGLLGLAPVRPAAAGADEFQLSLDGRRWSSSIDRPLFDADRRWVPGDTETVSVWVRTATDAAGLTIHLVDRSPGSRLDEDLRLSASANGRPLSSTAGYPVVPGGPVRVDVTVAFPATAASVSQRRRTDFALRVSLTQLTGGELLPPGREAGLPATGATTLTGVLLVAGPLLLSVGAALLGARRRHRSSGEGR